MKKVKSIFGVLILATCMVGNSFAGDLTSKGVFSLFDSFLNAIVSVVASPDDNCEGRICTNCKPQSQGGDGNCRPTE